MLQSHPDYLFTQVLLLSVLSVLLAFSILALSVLALYSNHHQIMEAAQSRLRSQGRTLSRPLRCLSLAQSCCQGRTIKAMRRPCVQGHASWAMHSRPQGRTFRRHATAMPAAAMCAAAAETQCMRRMRAYYVHAASMPDAYAYVCVCVCVCVASCGLACCGLGSSARSLTYQPAGPPACICAPPV